jgi:Flp pilus assembly pilin Flp
MVRMRDFLRLLARDEDGQAFVEYILGLSMAVVVTAAIARSFRVTLFGLWRALAKEISAPCPGCPTTLGQQGG